jgi:Protein of unknown function (DUF3347)
MTRSKLVIVIAGLCLALGACNQATKVSDQRTSSKDAMRSQDTLVVLKDGLSQQVYKHYNHLKEALVSSDSAEAKKAGNELAEALAQIKGCESTLIVAKQIGSSTNIKNQRTDFIPLSSDIITLLKHADIVSGKMYIDYCPMANDGKGAYWLASASEIRNPYYGGEMLNCGEVKEEIKKK